MRHDHGSHRAASSDWVSLMLFLILTSLFITIFSKGFLCGYEFAGKQTKTMLTTADEAISGMLPGTTSRAASVFSDFPTFTPVDYGRSDDPEYVAAYKEMYRKFIDAAVQFEDEVHLTLPADGPLTMQDIMPVNEVLGRDPALFWVAKASWVRIDGESQTEESYTVNLDFKMGKAERDYFVKEICKKTEEIISEFPDEIKNDPDLASKAVMDWLAVNCMYAYDEESGTAVAEYPYDTLAGPLLHGKAICSGFAKAYSFLMANLGYDTAYCTGTSQNQYHAWNLYVGADGQEYAVDPTFYSAAKDVTWLKASPDEFYDHALESKCWFTTDTTEQLADITETLDSASE